MIKNPPANVGDIRDVSSLPGSERFPGGGNGNLLQYSCLENPMDRGAWRAAVHGVTQSWTRLSDYTHTHMLLVSGDHLSGSYCTELTSAYVHYFPTAAVMLTTIHIYYLKFWRSEGFKSRCQQCCVPFRGSQRVFISLPFRLLEAACIS